MDINAQPNTQVLRNSEGRESQNAGVAAANQNGYGVSIAGMPSARLDGEGNDNSMSALNMPGYNTKSNINIDFFDKV
jgi:type V secretory pathway adhesin AidA